jgi:hypothetical protein
MMDSFDHPHSITKRLISVDGSVDRWVVCLTGFLCCAYTASGNAGDNRPEIGFRASFPDDLR